MTEESLFQQALSRSPEERAAFLEQACAGQPELRTAVELLLSAHEKTGNILDQPPTDLGKTVDSDYGEARGMTTEAFPPNPEDGLTPLSGTQAYRPNMEAGAVIAGRYTLQQKIGEGGMGEVWIAQQTEPVRRKVAIKLIKAGMNSKAVLARFEAERQALALMDHPNIARVLDGGLTPMGQPFFAMELVNGQPLTKFCDEAKLGIQQRLEIFIPICQAVQHAYQKGVIHRDLKPSNILMTLIDGRPVPKVIDFGVAKATSGRLSEESLDTQFGAVVGTLEYMAPEQAGLSGEDIDTRADIYSLGIILYEMLTGLRPLDGKRLKKAALTEMIRIIKEEEPQKPSTRLSTDESAPSAAALRHTEPHKLSALLRGELDWVVMKCLEKQRDRRYETANGLARDIQRYLANEVVDARPPSAGYRVRKFLGRHKGPVLAASLLVLALVAGIAGTSFGLIRAEKARAEAVDRAEGERQAKLEALSARDQAAAAEKAEAAQRAQAEQNAFLAGKQATLALNTIQDLIVQVRTRLNGPNLFEVKTALLETALKRVDGVASVYDGSTSKEATVLAVLNELAKIYRELGQSEKAFRLLEKCLEIAKARVKIKEGSDPSRQNLANTYRDLAVVSAEYHRDMKASLAYNDESLRIWDDVYKNPKADQWRLDRKIVRYFLAEAYTRVGVGRYNLGDMAQAREHFRNAFQLRQQLIAETPDDPMLKQDLSYSTMALAESSFRLGDRPQADDYYRQTLEQRQKMIQETPRDVKVREELAGVNYMIGVFKLKTGDLAAARLHLERCKEIRVALVDADPQNAIARRNLGIVFYQQGNLADREKNEKAATEAFQAARENPAEIGRWRQPERETPV